MEYSLAVIAAGLNLRSTRPPLPQGLLNFLFRGTASRFHCEVSSASLEGNVNHNPRPRCGPCYQSFVRFAFCSVWCLKL
jgi:hypothetical protein